MAALTLPELPSCGRRPGETCGVNLPTLLGENLIEELLDRALGFENGIAMVHCSC
jgi:hypothetical protein